MARWWKREEKAVVPISALSVPVGSGAGGQGYGSLARRGFMGNPVACRCVRMVAEAVACVPLVHYRGGAEVSGSPEQVLLARPNPGMAGPEFMETLVGHLLLSGNAYVEPVLLNGERRALYAIRPDRVTAQIGRDGWTEAYAIETARGTRRVAVAGEAGDLLHLKLFHPLNDHTGLSPLASAAAALDLGNAAASWNKALLDNSARPSGALVYQPKEGGNLSPTQFERLKRELEEGYSGSLNAGRPLLLEGGLDWKAMGLTPRDMDFTEARNGAARDIALALGVPPMLLGIPGDNTYANYQEANRAFIRLTVLPLMTRVLSGFAHWFDPDGRAELRIEPDLDRIPGLSNERDQLWARIGAAAFLTDAEKREAVGYSPDGGPHVD